ncbi:hypothetical protein JXB41_04325 [Candidatus Woesearchaeota archaeon]|nr:hypothetical protein [Candidatus Woesearchaeota archaeon]
MKIDIDDLEETYKKCEASGFIKEKNEINIELIKSLKKVAESGLDFIKDKSKTIKKDSTGWTFVFRDYYESLRGLIDAYLLFDRIEADRHQCKNAYLCHKYPELELNWEFLETVRLKRNRINYRGETLNYNDWQQFRLQFTLHINKLKEELNKKLEEIEL